MPGTTDTGYVQIGPNKGNRIELRNKGLVTKLRIDVWGPGSLINCGIIGWPDGPSIPATLNPGQPAYNDGIFNGNEWESTPTSDIILNTGDAPMIYRITVIHSEGSGSGSGSSGG